MAPNRTRTAASRRSTANLAPALLANHHRFLAFVEKRVGDRQLAEDILQAALVRSLESPNAPHGSEEGMVAWMYRALRNALVDHGRRQATEGRVLEREAREMEGAHDHVELRRNVCTCMYDVLPSLKPEYAEVLRRVDLEERSVPQVAAALGISPNNAGVRLHRARQALKRALQVTCGSCASEGCLDCSCKKNPGACTAA